jgi:hypothetical protein
MLLQVSARAYVLAEASRALDDLRAGRWTGRRCGGSGRIPEPDAVGSARLVVRNVVTRTAG